MILLVLVRDGRGEHCPDSIGSRLQTVDRDEIRLYKSGQQLDKILVMQETFVLLHSQIN